MSKICLTVLFFASLHDRAGVKSAEIELSEGATLSDLKVRMVTSYPGLAEIMKSVLVAVNHEYADDTTILPGSAEVAFFPPVSGG